MEFLKDIGIAGFLFFLIKGILWIVLFALMYFGLISKEKANAVKRTVFFWRKKQ